MPGLILSCSSLSILLIGTSKQRWKKSRLSFSLLAAVIQSLQNLLPFLISVFLFFFFWLTITKFLLSPCFSVSACSYCLSLSPFLHIILKCCIQDQTQCFSISPPIVPKGVSQMSLVFVTPAFTFSAVPSTNSWYLMSKVESPIQSSFCGACCVTSCPSWGIQTANCWGIKHSEQTRKPELWHMIHFEMDHYLLSKIWGTWHK